MWIAPRAVSAIWEGIITILSANSVLIPTELSQGRQPPTCLFCHMDENILDRTMGKTIVVSLVIGVLHLERNRTIDSGHGFGKQLKLLYIHASRIVVVFLGPDERSY